ncbi:MAG: hypothetical protein DWQ07_15460 [Chloroflexi bacterium]|nr:MAG: hypothetical protein DWQ07_15460 [Chloroflexota bacterium]
MAVAVGMNAHSITRHGISEVSAIHNCIQQNGPVMTFRSTTDPNRFYQLCQLPDGRFGMRTVQHLGEGLYKHVTSFIPKDGSWPLVREYILKFATRFTGAMP